MQVKISLLNCFASHCILLWFISFLVNHVQGKGNVTYPNALAYETSGKGNKFAEYRDGPGDWANMKRVLKNGKLNKLGSLCVTGTFLLYGKNDYYAVSEKDIRLLSGINSCSAPGMAMSIQAASAGSNDVNDPSIVLFEQTILRGKAYGVSKRAKDIKRQFGGNVRSILINGNEPYTVWTQKGESYCIKPKAASKKSICYIMDLKLTLIEKDNLFVNIDKGCTNDTKLRMVYLNNCLPFGSGKLEKLAGKAVKNDNNTIDSSDGIKSPITGCSNDELLNLIEFTQTHDFANIYQTKFPVDKTQIWRTELLDSSFDIMFATCPDEMVDTEFLQTIRELYIYKAEQMVWSKKKAWPLNETSQVRDLVEMTEECLDTLYNSGSLETQKMASIADFGTLTDGKYKPEDFMKELAWLGDLKTCSTDPKACKHDIIMEVIYLIFNNVATLCHHAFDYSTNFWFDYAVIFNDMYLEPMKDFWIKPGNFLNYYQIIFGGIDTSRQLQGLGICITNSFQAEPTTEFLPKPEGVPEYNKNKMRK